MIRASKRYLNLVDALILKGLYRVGDDTITKLFNFASSNNLSQLEDFSKVGVTNLGFKKVPDSLKELLNSTCFKVERSNISNKIEDWKKQGVSVIHLGSTDYPNQLLGLAKPPPFLFCRGNLKLLCQKKAIAVVGTRGNSSRGKLITIKTVEEFGKQGFCVVSGLALGIDTIAHRAALDTRAPTIAVLVDVLNISPSSNRALADEILSNDGLLLAENEPGIKAIPAFFAKRDRIQAGLSTAVFAIETSIDGGTMHAVNAALSMTRPVFVPDPHAAGYADLSAKEISGTQYLLSENKATYYTKKNYQSIGRQLSEENKIVSNSQQRGLL